MSCTLNVLKSYFDERGVSLPDGPKHFLSPEVISHDDDTHFEDVSEARKETDLQGMVLNIEYIKANAKSSLRTIEIKSVHHMDDGAIVLTAFCFVSQSIRYFRLDRIKALYDQNGHEINAKRFFMRFGLSFVLNLPIPKMPGTEIRKSLSDQAVILVALARVDGRFCDSELQEIISYAVKETEINIGPQSDEDVLAFKGFIQCLNPQKETLIGAIENLEGKLSPSCRRRFLAECVRLMNVDGIQHKKEFEFIANLQQLLGVK